MLAILRYPLSTAGRHNCTTSTTATACCSATTLVLVQVVLLFVEGVVSGFTAITLEDNIRTCSILSLYFWVAVKPPRRRPERRTATSRSSSVVSVLVLAAEMPHVRFIMSIYDVWFDVYLTHKKMSKCCGAVFLITFMQTKYGVLKMILGVVARCWGCIFPSLNAYHDRTYPLGDGGHTHDAI